MNSYFMNKQVNIILIIAIQNGIFNQEKLLGRHSN